MINRVSAAGLVFLLSVGVRAPTHAAAEPLADGRPHKAWASSWPGGPVKVVFVAAYAALHDAHELQRRFDIEIIPVATKNYLAHDKRIGFSGHYWPTLLKSADAVQHDIREALRQDWDVIVLRTPGWSDALSDDIRSSIMEAVTAGRTLVTEVHPVLEEAFAAAGTPLERIALPAHRFALELSEDPPGLYRCGDGHVLHFMVTGHPATRMMISGSGGFSDYAYSAGRAGWYLRQAARPATPVHLTSLEVHGRRLEVVIASEPSIKGGRIDVAVRRHEQLENRRVFTQYVFEATRRVRRGAALTLDLPRLPGGEYQVEVCLVDGDGRTHDWEAIRFERESDVTLKSVRIEPSTAAAGETLRGILNVEGATDGVDMIVRWFDQWGRLLIESPATSKRPGPTRRTTSAPSPTPPAFTGGAWTT